MFRTLAERLSRKIILKRKLPERYGGAVVFTSPDASLRNWRLHIEKTDSWLLEIAAELVKPDSTVWDVGANVGLFSAAAAGLGAKVLAIEPDTWLVELLRRTARLTPFTVLPVAISDRQGVAEFHIATRGRAANHLATSESSQAGGARETQTVVTTTLDWLLERFQAPQIVKVDVEGAEIGLLKGAETLLSKVRPTLIIEVSPDNIPSASSILLSHGYQLFNAEVPVIQRTPLVSADWNTLAVPSISR